jgi:hypothetical protein
MSPNGTVIKGGCVIGREHLAESRYFSQILQMALFLDIDGVAHFLPQSKDLSEAQEQKQKVRQTTCLYCQC